MKQILYVSVASNPITDSDMKSLLNQARSNNDRDHVSGKLVYVDGQFLQLIEGVTEQVDATFDRIKIDPRHHNIQLFIEHAISVRTFPDWTMGYVVASIKDVMDVTGISQIHGLSDLYKQVQDDLMKDLIVGLTPTTNR